MASCPTSHSEPEGLEGASSRGHTWARQGLRAGQLGKGEGAESGPGSASQLRRRAPTSPPEGHPRAAAGPASAPPSPGAAPPTAALLPPADPGPAPPLFLISFSNFCIFLASFPVGFCISLPLSAYDTLSLLFSLDSPGLRTPARVEHNPHRPCSPRRAAPLGPPRRRGPRPGVPGGSRRPARRRRPDWPAEHERPR